jgi:hypothetical protein
MTRMVFLLLALIAGGCTSTCNDLIVTVDQHNFGGAVVYCDLSAKASYLETKHGLLLLCTCSDD